jgi:hypothetical protein
MLIITTQHHSWNVGIDSVVVLEDMVGSHTAAAAAS